MSKSVKPTTRRTRVMILPSDPVLVRREYAEGLSAVYLMEFADFEQRERKWPGDHALLDRAPIVTPKKPASARFGFAVGTASDGRAFTVYSDWSVRFDGAQS